MPTQAFEQGAKPKKGKLVSIIVPVYNASLHLRFCLDSIRHQSYEQLEVLLVDDGSTDDSGIMCDAYAQLDSRFIVWHTPNGGAAKARNFALEHLSGEYVAFVDADDLLHPEAIRYMVELMQKHDIDCVQVQMLRFHEEENLRYADQLDGNTHIHSLNRAFLYETGSGPCGKLFKSDIINKNHIRFKEGVMLGEDLFFSLSYALHCQSGLFSKTQLYYYRQGTGVTSITPTAAERFTVDDMARCLTVLNGIHHLVDRLSCSNKRELYDTLFFRMERHVAFCNKYISLMEPDKQRKIWKRAKLSIFPLLFRCSTGVQKDYLLRKAPCLRKIRAKLAPFS